jgi:hypothetical protein
MPPFMNARELDARGRDPGFVLQLRRGRISRPYKAYSRLIQRLSLDPSHGGLALELMADAVVTGVGCLTAARARMHLAHHGSIGLFCRPHLYRVTVRTTNGIRSLHGALPPSRLPPHIIVCVQLAKSPIAAFFRTAARASRRIRNYEFGSRKSECRPSNSFG